MRHVELYDSCINHYVEFDTDEIEIDGKTLSEHDKEVYNQALEDLENRYIELVEAEYGKFAYKDGLVSRAIRSLKQSKKIVD